jgi:hypothetical protein
MEGGSVRVNGKMCPFYDNMPSLSDIPRTSNRYSKIAASAWPKCEADGGPVRKNVGFG